MRQDLTEIVLILDESGSMDHLRDDVIGGYNRFVEDQKKEPGHAKMTVVHFNSPGHYQIRHNGAPLPEVHGISSTDYAPSGMTALLDAPGKTIDEVGQRLEKTDEKDRPGQVLFVVWTDGEENSSVEYKYDQVKKRIEHQQEKYNWKFLWMGSGLEVAKQGLGLGILSQNVYNVAPTGKANRQSYVVASSAASRLRSGGAANFSTAGLGSKDVEPLKPQD